MGKKFDPQKAAEKVAKKPEVAKRLLECFKKMKGHKSWTVGQLTAAIVQDGFNDLLDLRPPYGTTAEELQTFRDALAQELGSESLTQTPLPPTEPPALTVLAAEPKTSPADSPPAAAADGDIPGWLIDWKETGADLNAASQPRTISHPAPTTDAANEPEPPPFAEGPVLSRPAHQSGFAVLQPAHKRILSRVKSVNRNNAIFIAVMVIVLIVVFVFAGFFVLSNQAAKPTPNPRGNDLGTAPELTPTPVRVAVPTPARQPTSPTNAPPSSGYVPPTPIGGGYNWNFEFSMTRGQVNNLIKRCNFSGDDQAYQFLSNLKANGWKASTNPTPACQ